MAKKITFQTIADELNVSKGLVSLAMRNKYGVSEEMRSKIVLKAIELGYEFKQNMQKQKKNITLLVKNMGILNEDFWRRCILGIETECANENVGFTILGWMSLNDGEDISMNILSEKCQGLIVLNQCQRSIVERISRLSIPIVFVDMINPLEVSSDQVMANNFNAGMQAVNYLLEKGHRNILLFGNIDYSFSFLQRYYGCMKAIKRAQKRGEPVSHVNIIDCVKTHLIDDVYQDDESDLCNDAALCRYLEENGEMTAIVCFNDSILRRVLSILKKRRLCVPEDISLISIDNVQCSEDNDITSVDIPKSELGVQAVRMLMERIENRRTNSVSLELNTTIAERNSVKDLNHEKN